MIYAKSDLPDIMKNMWHGKYQVKYRRLCVPLNLKKIYICDYIKQKTFSSEVYNICRYNVETIIKDDDKEEEDKWMNTFTKVLNFVLNANILTLCRLWKVKYVYYNLCNY